MLSGFGRVLLEVLDEQGMTVPDLAEEMVELGYDFDSEEVADAIADVFNPTPVGMVVGVADALELDSEEFRELTEPLRVDARWRLLL